MGEGAKLSKGFFMRSVLSKEKYWWQRLSNPAADSNWGFFGVLFEFPAESPSCFGHLLAKQGH